MNKLDIQNLDGCADIFSDDFVWHYFNPKRPELEGNYRGVSGLKRFFNKMKSVSKNAFQVKPVDTRPIGNEFIVVHACNRFAQDNTGEGTIEFDAVIVWRIVAGKIVEAWDIPAINTVRKPSENVQYSPNKFSHVRIFLEPCYMVRSQRHIIERVEFAL